MGYGHGTRIHLHKWVVRDSLSNLQTNSIDPLYGKIILVLSNTYMAYWLLPIQNIHLLAFRYLSKQLSDFCAQSGN